MRPSLFLLLFLSVVTAPIRGQLVRQANTTLAFPATLPSETGYATESALGTLTFVRPLALRTLPGVANRLFVVERGGTIQQVNLDTNTKSTFLNLTTYLTAQGTPIYTSSEGGLLSMAFHPDYNNNGYIFIFYSFSSTTATGSQLHQRVARLRATGTAGNYLAATTVDTTTHTPLITQRDEAGNHNGGDLHFGADGYLYISMGDEGAQYDGSDNARRIAKDFLGGIARIDVDLKPGSLTPNPHTQSNSTAYPSAISAGSYAIPPDNPFIGFTTWNGFTFLATQVRTEWWAHGFRNPWRMHFDTPTGRLFVADVGQDNWEEISIIARGNNGGWSWREGLHTHTPAVAPTTPPVGWTSTPSIYEYPHSATSSTVTTEFRGNSVTGGVIYRGTRLTELTGRYVFADYVSGRIWSLTDTGAATWAPALLFSEAANVVSSFGQDPRNGDVLYTTLTATGQVKRLVRTFGGTAPPPTLSAAGIFTNLATLTPQPGIVPYEPNVSFWSDHALKSRWFSIPAVASKMTWAADGVWTFPVGQTWVKHFEIEMTRGNPATRRRLETRVLVKNAAAAYGITYKWRSDNSDADLVGDAGLTEVLNITDNGSPVSQTWRYPSRSECMACHNPTAGYALSFNSRQLNRDFTHGTVVQNQLSALTSAGYFTAAPTLPATAQLALAPLTNVSQSLEWRVRSYLDANCAACHQPGGAPGNWDARAFTGTDLAGIINGNLINTGGDLLNRFTVPGDTAHSVVLRRMRGDPGYAKMPPVSILLADQVAQDTITQWIGTLTSQPGYTDWKVLHFGSANAPEAAGNADPDRDGVPNDREFLISTNPTQASAEILPTFTFVNGQLVITCPQIANRSTLLETSTDLTVWTTLDHPDNKPSFPAVSGARIITTPITASHRFLRLRITSP